jgi:hypothetical protein
VAVIHITFFRVVIPLVLCVSCIFIMALGDFGIDGSIEGVWFVVSLFLLCHIFFGSFGGC